MCRTRQVRASLVEWAKQDGGGQELEQRFDMQPVSPLPRDVAGSRCRVSLVLVGQMPWLCPSWSLVLVGQGCHVLSYSKCSHAPSTDRQTGGGARARAAFRHAACLALHPSLSRQLTACPCGSTRMLSPLRYRRFQLSKFFLTPRLGVLWYRVHNLHSNKCCVDGEA